MARARDWKSTEVPSETEAASMVVDDGEQERVGNVWWAERSRSTAGMRVGDVLVATVGGKRDEHHVAAASDAVQAAMTMAV